MLFVLSELESDNMLQKSMTKTPGSERKKNKSVSEGNCDYFTFVIKKIMSTELAIQFGICL